MNSNIYFVAEYPVSMSDDGEWPEVLYVGHDKEEAKRISEEPPTFAGGRREISVWIHGKNIGKITE